MRVAIAIALIAAASSGCAGENAWIGCAEISGGQVDVTGERGSQTGHDRSDQRRVDRTGQEEPEPCDNVLGRCGTYEVVLLRATMTDIASFAPSVSPATAEPADVGIAGLPLNLIASTATHTRSGELFDLPVTVRFRPVSYTFDHGDGTRRETDAGGRTWAQLGVPQFSPTATSHVYRERGTYTVRTTVHLAADVDFGNGWSPVEGLLAVPAGDTTVEILQAHTALVEHTCLENPRGAGC